MSRRRRARSKYAKDVVERSAKCNNEAAKKIKK